MAVVKPLVTTTVTVHSMDGPIVFADAVGEAGRVTRDGTIARQQILDEKTVSANATGGFVEIPYHAVIMAIVTVAESDPITEPEDTFCVSENDGGSDDGGSDDGGSDDGGAN